jgi:hypothetical protein
VKIYLRIVKVRNNLIPSIKFWLKPWDLVPINREWAKALFLLDSGVKKRKAPKKLSIIPLIFGPATWLNLFST